MSSATANSDAPNASANKVRRHRSKRHAPIAARNQLKNTQVTTRVFLAGHFGTNNSELFASRTDPDQARGMSLITIDADGPALSRLDVGKGDQRANLAAWHDCGRFHIIQLSRPGQKLFGAGGDPKVGEKAMDAAKDEVAKYMKGSDLNLLWIGAGGGTGTSVAKGVSELSKDKGIPLISIVVTPFNHEGNKVAIAFDCIQALRETSRSVFVLKNSKVPAEMMEKSTADVYDWVNKRIEPIFRHMTHITQVTGIPNVDIADQLALMNLGKDGYIGWADINPNTLPKNPAGLPEVNPEKVVEELLNEQLQDNNIDGKGMIFVFSGPWATKYQHAIINDVREKVRGAADMFIKSQVIEATDEMFVSVMIIGDRRETSNAVESSVPKIEPTAKVAAPNGNGNLVEFQDYVSGEIKTFKAPQDLVDQWKTLREAKWTDNERMMAARDKLAGYNNGQRPDMNSNTKPMPTT